MKLSKYDNKFISLTNIRNDTYEGLCTHNSKDYTFHEYGVDEESIDIQHILFYKSQIKKIKLLKDNNTPYSPFTSSYGNLEKEIIEGGPDLIYEVFDSEYQEDNIHIYRLLIAIEDYIKNKKIANDDLEEIKKLIKRLLKYNEDTKIIEVAKKLLTNK